MRAWKSDLLDLFFLIRDYRFKLFSAVVTMAFYDQLVSYQVGSFFRMHAVRAGQLCGLLPIPATGGHQRVAFTPGAFNGKLLHVEELNGGGSGVSGIVVGHFSELCQQSSQFKDYYFYEVHVPMRPSRLSNGSILARDTSDAATFWTGIVAKLAGLAPRAKVDQGSNEFRTRSTRSKPPVKSRTLPCQTPSFQKALERL